MHNIQDWAMLLERAFKRFSAITPEADAYRTRPNEAIEEGLNALYTLGVIRDMEDLKIFLESYTNFQGQLSELLIDDNNVFELENLIRQLDIMYQKFINRT